jgi:hypothetical protein
MHNRFFGIITREGDSGMVAVIDELKRRISTATGINDPPLLVYVSNRAATVLDHSDLFQDSEKPIEFSKITVDPILQRKMGFTVDRSDYQNLPYTNDLTIRGRALRTSAGRVRVFKLSPPGTSRPGVESGQTLLDGFGNDAEQCSKPMVGPSGILWDHVNSGPCSLQKQGFDGNWHTIEGYQMLPYSGWWEMNSGSFDVKGRGGDAVLDPLLGAIPANLVDQLNNSTEESMKNELKNRFDKLRNPRVSYSLPDQMSIDEAYILREVCPGLTFVRGGRGELHVGPVEITGGFHADFLRFRYIDQICTKFTSLINTLDMGTDARTGAMLTAQTAISALLRGARAIISHYADAVRAASTDAARNDLIAKTDQFVDDITRPYQMHQNRHDQVSELHSNPETGGYTIPPYNAVNHGDAFLFGCFSGPMLLEIAKANPRPAPGAGGAPVAAWPDWAISAREDIVKGVNGFRNLHEKVLARIMKYALVMRPEGLSPWLDAVDYESSDKAVVSFISALIGDLVFELPGVPADRTAPVSISRSAFDAAFVGTSGNSLLDPATADPADDALDRDWAIDAGLKNEWTTYRTAGPPADVTTCTDDETRALRAIFVRLRVAGLDNPTCAAIIEAVAQKVARTQLLSTAQKKAILDEIWQQTPGLAAFNVVRDRTSGRIVLGYAASWNNVPNFEAIAAGITPKLHRRGISNAFSDATYSPNEVNEGAAAARGIRALRMGQDEGNPHSYPRLAPQQADFSRQHISTGKGRAAEVFAGTAPVPGAGEGEFDYLTFLNIRMDHANNFWLRHRLDEYKQRYGTVHGRELHFLLFLCYISTPFTLAAMQNWMQEYLVIGNEKHFVPPPINLEYTWYNIEYEKSDVLACMPSTCKIFSSPSDARWIYDPMSTRVFLSVYQRRAHIVPRPEMAARVDNAWVRMIKGMGFRPLDLAAEAQNMDQQLDSNKGQFVVTMAPISTPEGVTQRVMHSGLLQNLREVGNNPGNRDSSINRAPWFGQNVFFHLFDAARQDLTNTVHDLTTNTARVLDLTGKTTVRQIDMPGAIAAQKALRGPRVLSPFIYRAAWRAELNGKKLGETAAPESPFANDFWTTNALRRNAGHPDLPARYRVELQ